MQRFAIAVVAAQKADVYMVDEPSSYLDVRQRLKAAQVNLSASLSHTLSYGLQKGQIFRLEDNFVDRESVLHGRWPSKQVLGIHISVLLPLIGPGQGD